MEILQRTHEAQYQSYTYLNVLKAILILSNGNHFCTLQGEGGVKTFMRFK